ncbi:MAG TPA: respiratory nitrate reductase subunit gamma [Pelomicrobium sp.]|nr:respiratory nitrate reductase subunit gamma [Pelomicrobium sp.]
MASVLTAAPAAKGAGWWLRRLAGVLLVAAGLAGLPLHGVGYGFLVLGFTALGLGILAAAVFFLTRAGDTEFLRRAMRLLFLTGGWGYVWAVCALAGYFVHEAWFGRVELRWMIFGPAVLAAIVVLDTGIYRRLIAGNLPTWERYRRFISREAADPAAMRGALLDEVILHRTLLSTSRLRWVRHTLIFWGFMLTLLTEGVAMLFREALPAFGLPNLWAIPDHPVRLGFDFLYDLFGLMMLAGCILALAWRAMVNGTDEQKYADTPSVLFLLFVVVSGFVVEGMRIAGSGMQPFHAVSFVGYGFALFIPARDWVGSVAYEALWQIHVLGSCLFLAYIPLKRLIHSCATPMGRLMNSQKGLLAAKKMGVMRGLLTGRGPTP